MNFLIGVTLFGTFAVHPGYVKTELTPEKITETIISVLKESPRKEFFSKEAVDLLVLTHITESVIEGKIKKKQISGGPAQGVFQMEPETERDIWEHYLKFNLDLKEWVESYASIKNPHLVKRKAVRDLQFNLKYQIAMARIYYERRAKLEVKSEGSYVLQLALFWKKHWNSPLGKGSVKKAIAKVAFYEKAYGGF